MAKNKQKVSKVVKKKVRKFTLRGDENTFIAAKQKADILSMNQYIMQAVNVANNTNE